VILGSVATTSSHLLKRLARVGSRPALWDSRWISTGARPPSVVDGAVVSVACVWATSGRCLGLIINGSKTKVENEDPYGHHPAAYLNFLNSLDTGTPRVVIRWLDFDIRNADESEGCSGDSRCAECLSREAMYTISSTIAAIRTFLRS